MYQFFLWCEHKELEMALKVIKIPPNPVMVTTIKQFHQINMFDHLLQSPWAKTSPLPKWVVQELLLAHLLHLISTCGKYQGNHVEPVGGVERTILFFHFLLSPEAITPQWPNWRGENCILHIYYYYWFTFMPSCKWIKLKLK